MRNIIRTLVLVAAFVAGAESAPARDRHDWTSGPLVESPFPADAEASLALPPLGSRVEDHKPNREERTGEPFPHNLAGVLLN